MRQTIARNHQLYFGRGNPPVVAPIDQARHGAGRHSCTTPTNLYDFIVDTRYYDNYTQGKTETFAKSFS